MSDESRAIAQIRLGHGQAGISVDESVRSTKKRRKQQRVVGAEGAKNMVEGARKLTAARKAQTTDSNN